MCGSRAVPLPALGMLQASTVLAEQVRRLLLWGPVHTGFSRVCVTGAAVQMACVRRQRRSAPVRRDFQEATGVFHDRQLEALRNAYVQLSGSGQAVGGLPVAQLPKLCVMAGLNLNEAPAQGVIKAVARMVRNRVLAAPTHGAMADQEVNGACSRVQADPGTLRVSLNSFVDTIAHFQGDVVDLGPEL